MDEKMAKVDEKESILPGLSAATGKRGLNHIQFFLYKQLKCRLHTLQRCTQKFLTGGD